MKYEKQPEMTVRLTILWGHKSNRLTALRTLSMRLRATTTKEMEAEGEETDGLLESVSKLEDKMMGLANVHVADLNGELRSTYDIMKDLAAVWNDLDTNRQASILETIAGKNRSSDVAAMLNNWKRVEEAQIAATNAAGTAEKEQGVYMESLQGHLNQLTASVQALSKSAIGEGLPKFFIDLGTGIVNATAGVAGFLGKMGAFPGIMLAAAAALTVFSSSQLLSGVHKIFDKLGGSITSIAKGFKNLKGLLKSGLGTPKGLMSWAGVATVAISAIAGAYQYYQAVQAEMRQKAIEAGKAASDENKNIKEMYGACQAAAQAYQEGTGTKESYDEATQNLLKSLGMEGVAVDTLINKYVDLNDAMERLTVDKLRENIETQTAAYSAAITELGNTSMHGAPGLLEKSWGTLFEIDPTEIGEQADKVVAQVREAITKGQIGIKEVTKESFGAVITRLGTGKLENLDDYKALMKDFETLNEILEKGVTEGKYTRNELANSPVVQLINATKGRLATEYQQVLDIQKNINDSVATIELIKFRQGNRDYQIPETIASYEALREQIIDATSKSQEFIGSQEDAKEALANALATTSGFKDMESAYQRVLPTLDRMKRSLASIGKEAADVRMNEFKDWLDSLSQEDLNIVVQITGKDEDFGQTLNEWNSKLESFKSASRVPFNVDKDLGKMSDMLKEMTGDYDALAKALKEMLSGQSLTAETVSALQTALGDGGKITDYLATENGVLGLNIEKWRERSAAMLTGDIEKITERMGEINKVLPGATNEEKAALNEELKKLKQVYEILTAIQDKALKASGMYTLLIDNEKERLEKLIAAIKESVDAAGLSDSTIEELTNRYGEYKGFDALFEQTANGIHLNTQALRQLEDEYEKNVFGIADNAADNAIEGLKEQYNRLTEEINNASDAQKKSELYKQRSGIKKQIDANAKIITQLKGMTSLYMKWKRAQEMGEEGAMYDDVSEALKHIKELYEQGLVGTNEFRAAVQMLSKEDLSNAGADEIANAYERAIPIAEKYFDGAEAGLQTFLEDINKINKEWAHLNENGEWEIDFGVGGDKKVADALGISVDAVQMILRKLSDMGFDINLDNELTDLNLAKTEAEDAAEALKRLGTTDYSFDFNTDSIAKLDEEIQEAQTLLDGLYADDGKLKIGVDEETAKNAKTVLDTLKGQKDALTRGGVLSGADEKTSMVKFGVDDSDVVSYQPEIKESTVLYKPQMVNWTPPILTGQILYKTIKGAAAGTAYARGRWGTDDEGVALGGELGTEIVVRDGSWFTIGDNGAEMFRYKKNDIIFNARQTDEIFKNGKTTFGGGRGRVFADGTAFSSGSGRLRPAKKTSGKSGSKAEEISYDIVDWIEVAIARIERVINNFARTAESAFKKLSTRLTATSNEISKVYEEIGIQTQGYARYMQQAESVPLAAGLKSLVQIGAIDITQYDEATADLISQYEEWYTKALDCADAVDELNESLGELYKSRFENVAKDFENQLEGIEHQATMLDEKIRMIEEKGYLGGQTTYQKMIELENQTIAKSKQEAAELQRYMNEAMASGRIEQGSEAWYDMRRQIDEVNEKIAESTVKVEELNNKIRELDWAAFDNMLSRIKDINDEAGFLVDLLSNDKLFTDKGQLTDSGKATMGLRAVGYDAYMAQADEYAKEIQKINQQIAQDPYDNALIERRKELLELQRGAISAAEDEKRAVKDLVKEGIEKELESLKKLIDEYKESLDANKELYEYQKNIKKQTENIASLRKQLAAYENDTSEENRARVQKLRTQLKEATEGLQEAEYNQYISDQKKLLDNLYDEYEKLLNERLDDINKLMSDMIDAVNRGSASIAETIQKAAADAGYTMTSEMKNIWQSGGGKDIAAMYGDKFLEKVTTVNASVKNIENYIAAMVNAGNTMPWGGFTPNGFAQGGFIAEMQKTAYRNGDQMLTVNTLKRGESVLDEAQTREFSAIARELPGLHNLISTASATRKALNGTTNGAGIGSVNYEINIPIEKVEDYNDFVKKMREDSRFEKMIQSMTVDRLSGGSKLGKYKFNW